MALRTFYRRPESRLFRHAPPPTPTDHPPHGRRRRGPWLLALARKRTPRNTKLQIRSSKQLKSGAERVRRKPKPTFEPVVPCRRDRLKNRNRCIFDFIPP